jgi:hypothetical protein
VPFDENPGPDLYQILDNAKLNATHVLTAKQSTSKTVTQIRDQIVQETTKYILAREAAKGLNNGTTRQ